MIRELLKKAEEAIDTRIERFRVSNLLKKHGFVVFCPKCGKILNEDQLPTSPSTGLYAYTCSCGEKSTFDMRAPVPIHLDS